MKISLASSKRGIALMVVLIAVFVLSMLAGAFAYSMRVEAKLAMNSNNQMDLEWLGRSGVEYCRWILAREMTAGCPYTALNQRWAQQGGGNACDTNLNDILDTVQLGSGTFHWHMTDLESKVNVNTADTPLLQQALTTIGANASDIPTISDSIQDWIDADDNPRLNGAESDYYQGLNPPYSAKNGPIDDLSELLLIKGIRDNPAIYSAKYDKPVDQDGSPLPPQYTNHMDEIFTPISTGKININTCSTAVLECIPGMDPGIAEQIVQQRAETPFIGLGDLGSAGFGGAGVPPTLKKYCVTRSVTFEVQIDAQIGSSKQTFHAILGCNNPRDIQILSFYWE